MLDSHLVMNVLNLMAARDFKEHGREDPLLFALSDYLQEAFQLDDGDRRRVADELRLMKVQSLLIAEVRGGAVDVKASGGTATHLVWAGGISGVANLLLKLGDGPRGRTSRLQVRAADTAGPAVGEGGGVEITMELQNAVDAGTAATLDIGAAQRRWQGVFAELRPPRQAPVARWTQPSPGHLQLTYVLPPAV